MTHDQDPSAHVGEQQQSPELGVIYSRVMGWLKQNGKDFFPADQSFRPLALIEKHSDGPTEGDDAPKSDLQLAHSFSRTLSGIPVAGYPGGKEFVIPRGTLNRFPAVADALGEPWAVRLTYEDPFYGRKSGQRSRMEHNMPAVFMAVDRLPETGVATEEIIIVPNEKINMADPDSEPAFLAGRAIWAVKEQDGDMMLSVNVRRQRLMERRMLPEGTLGSVSDRELFAFTEIAKNLDTIHKLA